CLSPAHERREHAADVSVRLWDKNEPSFVHYFDRAPEIAYALDVQTPRIRFAEADHPSPREVVDWSPPQKPLRCLAIAPYNVYTRAEKRTAVVNVHGLL